MLIVQLFGDPQIKLKNKIVKLPRRKSRAVLYYLAAHPQPLTRDHLLALFWPDLDRPAAQQTLRTTLHGLRQALGDLLLADDDKLAFSGNTAVDTRHFEAALNPLPAKAPALTAALELYRGHFLQDFSLPDTPAFEDWVSVQREHYQRVAVRGLTALAKHYETAQNYDEALTVLARALAFDPLQEDLQRDCMRLQYLAGDRAGAIRRYTQLRKLLDEEMGVPPMAETRALYDAIITDKLSNERKQLPPATRPSTATLAPLNTTLPFIGRATELQQLQSAEPHRLILIEGEAGIGKTRLAQEFLQTQPYIVLQGAARELEQTLPYQPIIEALRSLTAQSEWPKILITLRAMMPPLWLAEVSRLLPEVGVAQTGSADESRLWEGVHQFLRALAQIRPSVLFIDDLQWADQSTLALLAYVVRQQTVSLWLIATMRPVAPRTHVGVFAQSLTREDRITRVLPVRLNSAEVLTIAQQLSGSFAQPLADWLCRLSEGNPYVLAEVLREARAQKILQANGVVNLTALTQTLVPETIYSLIQARLARLSETARRVLDAGVAVGREFDFEVAAQAAALSESAALDALDELRAAGLVQVRSGETTGRLYHFDHTLTMEVAYREVGELRHRLLHRRVAEALEVIHHDRLDEVAGLLASHFAEGNAPDRAGPYALRAAEQAVQLAAWKEAAAFYMQALPLVKDRPQQLEIYLALGNAQFNAGHLVPAAESFRTALTLAQQLKQPAQISAARFLWGRALLLQGHFGEAIELAQQSLALNPFEAEMTWGIALSLEGADLANAAEHLQKAEALYAPPTSVAMLAQVQFELGSVAAQQGELARAVTLYQTALHTAEQSSEADVQKILALNNLAYHLHLLHDPSAVGYAERGLALAREAGALFQQTYLLSTLGEIALAANEVTQAEKLFAEGLAIAEQLAIPERIAGLTANLGRVAAVRAETATAIHRYATALAKAEAIHSNHLAAQIRLWLVPLLPQPEAQKRLQEAKALAQSSGRQRLLAEIEALEKTLSTN